MDRLTKRDFLKRAALAAGSVAATGLLAACAAPAPAPAPTAAPKAAEAPKPTEAPKAAEAPKPTEAPKPSDAAKVAPAKEQVTLRFHMRAGGETGEPAIYDFRPKEWEQETGYKFKLEPIPGGKDYIPKIDALAASKTIGDLTWTSDVYAEHTHLVRFGVLEPVEDFLAPFNVKKSEWFPGITESLTFNGKMYGLPKTGHPVDSYIWLNLKMFDEAGIKRPPTFGNSLDDVKSWAIKLSKGPKDRREVYGYWTNNTGVMPITTQVRQMGSDLIDKDGVKSLADNEAYYDWAKWNDELINAESVVPTAEAIPSGGVQAVFGAGKVAMVHNQRAFQRAARIAVADKFEFTTIQFPMPAKSTGFALAIDTHSGTAQSKYKKETFTLLYALADRRFAYLVGKDSGYLTGRIDNLDALKELASDHFMQLQQKNVELAKPFWRMKNLRHYELQDAITNHMDTLWLGKRKLDKAFMNELKQSMDQVLSKPE